MMNKSPVLRRLLLAPPGLRRSLSISPHSHLLVNAALPSSIFRLYNTTPPSSTMSPAFWASMIPKPLRRSASASKSSKPKSKEWNPATFFIVIFMLIGSMSIQMIALKNGFATFMRRADAKIGLLNEVIGRIQNGEEVDVEGLLGTGDSKREQEWAEVLREIEEEDQLWENSKRPKPKHGKNAEKSAPGSLPIQCEPVETKPAKEKPASDFPTGFY